MKDLISSIIWLWIIMPKKKQFRKNSEQEDITFNQNLNTKYTTF